MVTNKKYAGKSLLLEKMNEQILRKRSAGKDATADLYRATYNWLLKFTNHRDKYLSDITPVFVDNYTCFLQSQGTLKVNTISSYLSAFRAMYNTIIRDTLYQPRIHPFAHVTIRLEKTAKRSVDKAVFEQIATLDVDASPELEMPADLCIFSFLACGIPFIDLAHLTYKNIAGNTLVYNRTKTHIPICVNITPGMRHLLDKYANSDSNYLFPILSSQKDISYEGYKSLLRKYNKSLKKIGDKLGVEAPFTSYVIRHTWASEALRNYVPVAVISQALGHTSEKTTRYYLAQLDQSELYKANMLVTGAIDNLVRKRA